jgi:hypothetical protein
MTKQKVPDLDAFNMITDPDPSGAPVYANDSKHSASLACCRLYLMCLSLACVYRVSYLCVFMSRLLLAELTLAVVAFMYIVWCRSFLQCL